MDKAVLTPYAQAIAMCLENRELMKGWDGQSNSVLAWARVKFPNCALTKRQARSLMCSGDDEKDSRRLSQRWSEQTTASSSFAAKRKREATEDIVANTSKRSCTPVQFIPSSPTSTYVVPPAVLDSTASLPIECTVETDKWELPLPPSDQYVSPPAPDISSRSSSPLSDAPPSPAPERLILHGRPSPEHIELVDHDGQRHLVYLPYIDDNEGGNLLRVECDLAKRRLSASPLIATSNPSGMVQVMHSFDHKAVAHAFSEGRPVVIKGLHKKPLRPKQGETVSQFLWREFKILPSKPTTVQSMRRKAELHASLEKSGTLYPPDNAEPVQPSNDDQPELTKSMTIGEFGSIMDSCDTSHDILACLELWLNSQDAGVHELQHLNHGLVAALAIEDRDYGNMAIHDALWSMLSQAYYVTLDHQDSEGTAIWAAIDYGAKIWQIAYYDGPPEDMEKNVAIASSYMHDAKALKKLGFKRVENVLLEAGDGYLQVPGAVHWVITLEECFTRGGSYYNLHSMHLTEAARRVDVLYSHLTTNVDADDMGVYGALASLLAALPMMHPQLEIPLRMRPMLALALMLLDPKSYSIFSKQLHLHPVYTVTVWRALRLTYQLGLDQLEWVKYKLSASEQRRLVAKAIPMLQNALGPQNFNSLYDAGAIWKSASSYMELAIEGERMRSFEQEKA
ncbi:hypothetical protein CYLTODRAFT_493641 [Cylindrobasidium torrendii FP15055 ss-10]|uniref:JmjC domain-containing protein n=1 Tax=Cylindrobasidium torrendii FP15055 ss-10 TaxID=1314674 RepID=A0A0D7B0P0_9AGAR|nr:hypothetical protein CYLTODRAFT_493641 [Cylindrobasidium torrendii FP15055 ss-10]